MRALFDGFNVTADAFTHLVFFGRHALAIRQERLVFAQVNNDVRAIKPAHGAADNVTHAVLELGENQLLLRPANMLHERLLGILRGNAPEIGGGHFHFDFISQHGIGLDPSGVENGDLVMLGNHSVGDHQLGKSLDIAVFLVNNDAQLARRETTCSQLFAYSKLFREPLSPDG